MSNPDTCPVPHKQQLPTTAPPDVCPVDHTKSSHPVTSTSGVCPIDHTAREAWLKQVRAANPNAFTSSHPIPTVSTQTQQTVGGGKGSSWSATLWSYVPFSGSAKTQSTSRTSVAATLRTKSPAELASDREISTIPRAIDAPEDPASTSPIRSSNHEIETGADPKSGNWIYPSEKMFFEAMKRKGHDARAMDMKTVVPIHNAVNERAWAEIKVWEAPYLGSCGGPKLHSFSGMSTKLTPKARVMTWMGYQAPFDRHDWVVDRCGQTVEYVIDFYPGKPRGDGVPSFYLDVRPKLNSWKGVKMRVLKGVGVY